MGPLPCSSGFTLLFTIIDRTTRWPEAVPISNISSSDCAQALFFHWTSRFGIPATIISDRGPQIISSLWNSLCSLLGIKRAQTTAYHPQANGLVERFHCQLKNSLRSRLADPDWFLHLPWVLLGIRIAPKEATDVSSAELVYGSTLTVPGDFIGAPECPPETFFRRLRLALSQQPSFPEHNRTTASNYFPTQLQNTSFVFIRNDATQPPLSPLYHSPYRVLKRGPKTFRLKIGGKEDEVSVD